MRITVKIQGQDKLIKKLEAFGKEGVKMIEDTTKINAQDIEAEAKRLAPVDNGDLKQNIKAQSIDTLNYVVTAYMPYSAYQEFGTGSLAEIPEEMQEIANQFNKHQNRYSIPPQPFMYPAFVKVRKQYPKDLEQGLEILTKKYSDD